MQCPSHRCGRDDGGGNHLIEHGVVAVGAEVSVSELHLEVLMGTRKRMNTAALLSVLGVIAVSRLIGGAAMAGGWAVTTLDPLPRLPVAGESTSVGFTIRQHGATPTAIDNTLIVIVRPGGADRHVFPGRADGPVGHYVSDVG